MSKKRSPVPNGSCKPSRSQAGRAASRPVEPAVAAPQPPAKPQADPDETTSRELIVRLQDQAIATRALFQKQASDVDGLRRQILSMKQALNHQALQSMRDEADIGDMPGTSGRQEASDVFINAHHLSFDYDAVLESQVNWDITQELISGIKDYKEWYSRFGRPVSIVIPSYNDTQVLDRCVRSIRRLIEGTSNRIIIADDASPSQEHHRYLNSIECSNILIVRNAVNGGFARNVNSALALVGEEDIVLLNSDTEGEGFWLEALQYACYASGSAIVGPKLLYPDRRVQHAGVHRNNAHPTWFDHYGRFAPESNGAVSVPSWMLAVTGACQYISNAAFKALGLLDPEFPMAFEDVDYCLRAWAGGRKVFYYPYARLIHHESVTRGRETGPRERRSQDHFWQKWTEWFDGRNVRTPDGRIRIVYVLEDTGIAGGHRNIFDQMNILHDRGHEVELYTLGPKPTWYDLRTPVHVFPDYGRLVEALGAVDAIKVATWWNTAEPVWLSSVTNGRAAYLVSDIESSYYVDDDFMRAKVLANYKREFAYMTICEWNVGKLARLGIDAHLVSCSVDRDTFHPLGLPRERASFLAAGRRNHLKNFQFTLDAWGAMGGRRPNLWMYGGEPTIAEFQPGARYFIKPTDTYLNVLINQATGFILTSRHEGFALTILEAMSAGTPVITTDCHGNRDFCRHGENCLIVADGDYRGLAVAMRRLMDDPDLAASFAAAGIETARKFSRAAMEDQLESFFQKVAA